MSLLCHVFTLFIVGMQVGVVVPDIYIDDPVGDFHFMYHQTYDLLLTLHGYGCYVTHMDGHLHDSMLQTFQYLLEDQVKAAILEEEQNMEHGVTLEEFRNRFGDVLGDFFCRDRDIYIITIDYLACDFEKYQMPCAWIPDSQKQLQWTIQRERTPSALTGPDVDHTLQTEQGHFIYMESNLGSTGDVAVLNSPHIRVDTTQGMCLRFWYSMYGDDVERLQVLAQDTNSPSKNLTLWAMAKNQGKGWKLAEVTVPKGLNWTEHMMLQLIAHRGPSHYGDIAVDDISSSPGICAPSLLNCSFEGAERLCYWTQVTGTDEMDWVIESGATPSTGTGPDQALKLNHTSNVNYLYMEGDSGNVGDVAELQSPSLHLQGPICLRFYYFMKGTGLGELEVVQVDGNAKQTVQWTRTATDQTKQWTPAEVTITAPDPHTPIRLKFRAVRGRSSSSDIAIDLISGLSGSCEQYPYEHYNSPQIIG